MRPGGIFRKIQSCVIEEYGISGFISDVFTRTGFSLFLRIGFNSNEYMRYEFAVAVSIHLFSVFTVKHCPDIGNGV